jgi:cell division protein FtsB
VSDGHRTTAIPRPRRQPAASDGRRRSARPDSGRDATRFGDLTRPIPADKRLVQGRRNRSLLALGALVVTTAIVAALFVLPVNTWIQQRTDLAAKRADLAVLNDANSQLTAEVARLQTADGIKEAAREEIGYVEVGEERISTTPPPDAPVTLPTGWPYDAVTQILAVRAAAVADVAPQP